LRLRGKLISIYSSIFLLILLVFGAIVYLTFRDTLTVNQEKILRFKAGAAALDIKNDLHTVIDALILNAYPAILAGTDNDKRRAAGNRIRDYLKGSKLFVSCQIFAGQGEQVLAAGRLPAVAPAKLLRKARQRQPAGRPCLFEESGYIFLAWPVVVSPARKDNYLVVVRTAKAALFNFFVEHLRIQDTCLLILDKDRQIFKTCFGKNYSFKLLTDKDISTALAGNDRFARLDDFFIFSPIQDLFSLKITYVIPRQAALQDLIHFKNRLIAAIIVLAWVTTWTILILAYRISKPITSLAQATGDIMSFDYATPLEFKPGSDEIGQLARTFETMRQKIEGLIIQDPLTKTYNRRYLMHIMGRTLARAQRYRESFSCLMLDIDYFKKINDTYGHQTGDEVLKAVGGFLTKKTRQYDTVSTVARYGGEEFVVLLPATAPDSAFNTAERIRQGVEDLVMYQSIRCTVSIGLAAFDHGTNETPTDLLNKADLALYEAKNSGRNKTVVYGMEAEQREKTAAQDEREGQS